VDDVAALVVDELAALDVDTAAFVVDDVAALDVPDFAAPCCKTPLLQWYNEGLKHPPLQTDCPFGHSCNLPLKSVAQEYCDAS